MDLDDIRQRILIIDDEPAFTEMVKLNLEATGRYIVKTENSGSRALATARQFKPHLILLDVIMPDIEGPDICSKLKSQPELQSIPIVFLTATIRKDELDMPAETIGGHAFLAKPSSSLDLIQCIEKILAE